jgi:hypothetical protein
MKSSHMACIKKIKEHSFWHRVNITATVFGIIFALILPVFLVFAGFTESVDINALQATTTPAYFPTSFTINIINASNTPLNVAEFELNYNPKALFITAIVPHDTLCEERFVITNSFNNASGTVLFLCGTITPFTQNEGVIATVHVIPLSSGTSSVTFGTSTRVLAHDGYGTDATRKRDAFIFTAI